MPSLYIVIFNIRILSISIEIFQIALGSDKEAIAEKEYLKYSKDDL